LSDVLDALRVLQGVIVVLGILIIYRASKGYGRTKQKSLLFLALGFLLVTVGAVSAGLLFELLNFQLIYADIVEAVFEVIGFTLMVYSILGTRD